MQLETRGKVNLPMATVVGESGYGHGPIQATQFRPVWLQSDFRQVETKLAVIGVDLDTALAIVDEPNVAAAEVPGGGGRPD